MTHVVPEIAVYNKADGSLLYVTSRANAPASGDATRGAVDLPSGYAAETFVWSPAARAMAEDAAKLTDALVRLVKGEAERRKMAVLTPGGAKKTEYADKAAEVRTWHTLGGTLTGVVAALGIVTGAKMRATFPYAIADAAAFGDTVDKAIARFSAGMSTSATVPTIAAVEAKACAAIKAATTFAGKRAAAAVTWP